MEAYDKKKFKAPIPVEDGEIGISSTSLHHIFGLEVTKRRNIQWISGSIIAYSAGNALILHDLENQTNTYHYALGGNGVGCFAVDPTKKFIAVGEKGNQPFICIYKYPEMELVKVLQKGTERSYASLHFAEIKEKGTGIVYLASVGGKPDYLLTVWDWEKEAIILRTKAFGQDVYNVNFSPTLPGDLVTSGTGHIRFWKMADTFTGLKLKGDIGKFGKVDLSDIEAYAILPDGKVLSSSESGDLLLWDGNFIKAKIVTNWNKENGNNQCHQSKITQVLHIRNGSNHKTEESKEIGEEEEGNQNLSEGNDYSNDFFVSASHDGTIKWWKFIDIDTAEVDADKSLDFEVKCYKTIQVGKGVKINCITPWTDYFADGKEGWLVTTTSGELYRVVTETGESIPIGSIAAHGSTINALATAPNAHLAATGGEDSTLRCWDVLNRRMIFQEQYDSNVTCLKWLSCAYHSGGRALLAGFSDGIVRVLIANDAEGKWVKKDVFKPHIGKVIAMELSPDGNLLATTGEDGTIFLFSSAKDDKLKFTPIGFLMAAEGDEAETGENSMITVNSLSWRHDSSAFIYGCSNGIVYECIFNALANLLEIDTSSTYKLNMELFEYRKYTILLPPKPKKEAEGKKGTEKEGDSETGDEDTAKKQEPVEDEEEEEQEEEVIVRVCLQVSYAETKDSFYATFKGTYAGYIYQCNFLLPYPTLSLPLGNGGRNVLPENISKSSLSSQERDRLQPYPHANILSFFSDTENTTNEIMMTANDDGAITLRIKSRIGNAGRKFARICMHENQAELTGVALTFDANLLVTTGTDGLLIVHNFNKETFISQIDSTSLGSTIDEFYSVKSAPSGSGDVINLENFPLPSPANLGDLILPEKEAEDITSSSAYTIQDAKLKMEADNLAKAASLKKDEKLKLIAEMRIECERLLAENNAKPLNEQLDPSEFIFDLEYARMLESEGQELLEEVEKELAYDVECCSKRLEKCVKYFMESVEMESTDLASVSSELTVASFRLLSLSGKTRITLSNIATAVESQARAMGTDSLTDENDSHAGLAVTNADDEFQGDTGHSDNNINKHELRKLLRKQRKEKLAALLAKKPGNGDADPRDLEAIAKSKANMGDYKLKSSPDFEVSESSRMDTGKKLGQIALLEESMYILKSRFNEKWRELRTFKYQLVEESKKSLSRIEKIDQLLQTTNIDTTAIQDIALNTAAYSLPSLSVADATGMPTSALSTEWPECRDSYTAVELNNFSLEVRRKGLMNAKAPAASTIPVFDSLSELNEDPVSGENNSSEYELFLIALERKNLIENLNNLITQYEEKLSELGRERVHVQADLKAAEVNLITLIQEYAQLLNFEYKDNMLSSKLSKYTTEKAEISLLIAECQSQLAERKKEIANWQVRENKLNGDFADLMKSAGKDYVTILTKIYKKKIKRTKKKPEGEEDDEDEESEDESEDEDYDDEEDEEDEEIVEDTCPDGCDANIHAKVLTLREIRLDLEEELQEFTKSIEEIKKMNDRYTQRTKQISKDLVQAGKEIQSFQTEKQVAMNQILTVVPLTLKQLYTVDVEKVLNNPDLRGVLPMTEDATMKSHVVMNRETLQELEKRIKYSEDAVKTEKINFRNLHKQRNTLDKEKKNKEIAIEDMDRKCIELQMLKFGQIIDLEKLDQNQVENPEEDILKNKVAKLESMFDDELKKLKTSNEKYRAKLLDVTKVNTQLLAQVASLSGKQLLMERELNNNKSGNGGLVADDEPLLKLDTDEKKKLTHLVALQTKELDVLKAEINLLRRKGGLVYGGSSS